jgi:hypothetical protein
MKKVTTDVEEFAARIADKEDNPTIHELVQKFPDKTYRELEKYRDADRQEEAAQIPMTESQKKQEELEPIGEEQRLRKMRDATAKIIELQNRAIELEEALANALAIEGSHQKLNGKLRERVTELEEENKKLKDHFEKGIDAARKAGI